MFAEKSFVSPTSSAASYGSLRESMRKAMYKKGTPPWKELHKQVGSLLLHIPSLTWAFSTGLFYDVYSELFE